MVDVVAIVPHLLALDARMLQGIVKRHAGFDAVVDIAFGAARLGAHLVRAERALVGEINAQLISVERRLEANPHIADLGLGNAVGNVERRAVVLPQGKRQGRPQMAPVVLVAQHIGEVRLAVGGGCLRAVTHGGTTVALQIRCQQIPCGLDIAHLLAFAVVGGRPKLHRHAIGTQAVRIVAILAPRLLDARVALEHVLQGPFELGIRRVIARFTCGVAVHDAVACAVGQNLGETVLPRAAVGRIHFKTLDRELPCAVIVALLTGERDLVLAPRPRDGVSRLDIDAVHLGPDLLLARIGNARKPQLQALRTLTESAVVVHPLLLARQLERLRLIFVGEGDVHRVVIDNQGFAVLHGIGRLHAALRCRARSQIGTAKAQIAHAHRGLIAVDAALHHVVLPVPAGGSVDVQVLEGVGGAPVRIGAELARLDGMLAHLLSRIGAQAVVGAPQLEGHVGVMVALCAPIEELLHGELCLFGLVHVVQLERARVAMLDDVDAFAHEGFLIRGDVNAVEIRVRIRRRIDDAPDDLAGAVLVAHAVLVVKRQHLLALGHRRVCRASLVELVHAGVPDGVGEVAVVHTSQIGRLGNIAALDLVAVGCAFILAELHGRPRAFRSKLLLQVDGKLGHICLGVAARVGPDLLAVGEELALDAVHELAVLVHGPLGTACHVRNLGFGDVVAPLGVKQKRLARFHLFIGHMAAREHHGLVVVARSVRIHFLSSVIGYLVAELVVLG